MEAEKPEEVLRIEEMASDELKERAREIIVTKQRERVEEDKKSIRRMLESYEDYIEHQWKYMEENPIRKEVESWMDGEWLQLDKDDPPPHLVRQVFEAVPGGEPDESPIDVADIDEENNRVKLERVPDTETVLIFRNLWQYKEQIRTLGAMREGLDDSYGTPLVRLFQDPGLAKWPESFELEKIDEWRLLNDADIPGVDLQRRFVRMAVSTPDFAFLEGPPGSGKTTVLCELALQLLSRGKRVFFCAPTHIAVDNLIEKLTTHDVSIMPLRIGDPRLITSEHAKQYTEKELNLAVDRLRGGADPETDLEREIGRRMDGDLGVDVPAMTSGLVCGTVMGLKKHLRDAGQKFDVMIIDEASKTTLQEFLVPASHAERWIISGDTRQLSPYTDQLGLIPNIEQCVADAGLRDVCHDVFHATTKGGGRVTLVISDRDDPRLVEMYRRQCRAYSIRLCAGEDVLRINELRPNPPVDGWWKPKPGAIAICTPSQLDDITKVEGHMYKIRNFELVRDTCDESWWGHGIGGSHAWADAVIRRLQVDYQERISGSAKKYPRQSDRLMPCREFEEHAGAVEHLDRITNISMASVLELLQSGYVGEDRGGSAILRGLPGSVLKERLVQLEYQYRMHPDIAGFSSSHVYHNQALFTPDSAGDRLAWSYEGYPSRLWWIDVENEEQEHDGAALPKADAAGLEQRRADENRPEAEAIMGEVERFSRWAVTDGSGGEWTVGILTFYKHQCELVGSLVGNLGERMSAICPGGDGALELKVEIHGDSQEAVVTLGGERRLTIRWGTVDSFQGKEADVTFISLTKRRPTSFLRNLHRLNVAVTRARYQCVIVGSQQLRSSKGIMAKLYAAAQVGAGD